MKNPLKLLAVGALTLCLALPGRAAQSTPTTITFLHNYNTVASEYKVFTEKVIPAFEKANPGIKVNSQVVPYDDLKKKIVTSIAGGAVPDVSRFDLNWTLEFAKLGALEPLNAMAGFPAVRASIANKDQFSTALLDGLYYGLPLNTNTQVLLYNADLLKAAGVGVPRTMTQFRAYLTKLQAKTGDKVTGWALAVPGPWSWFVMPWVWSNGGEVTDPKLTRASGYLNGPRTVEAIQTLYDWYKAGLIAPSINRSGLSSWEGLGAGRYASIQDGPRAYPALKTQFPKLNLVHARFPTGPAGSISTVGGDNIAIFKESRNKEAAWKFVRFMLSADAQKAMAPTGVIPVNAVALRDPYLTKHPTLPVYLSQLKTARVRWPHPEFGKIQEVMDGAFVEIFDGKQPVQKALDAAATKVDQLLK